MTPQLIFGTATLGMDMTEFQDAQSVQILLKQLPVLDVLRLDTGARYPPMNPGRSEELIGEAKKLNECFIIDTKVYTNTKTDGSGDLTSEATEKSLCASLQRLRKTEGWGVSNVPPAMLEEMLLLCEEKGLQKPSCYQGEYNVVTRGMETKLLPILRSHGMSFNAFRPIAGGFLTGKLVNNEYAGTRFGDDNPLGKVVQKLFSAEDLHSAMRTFDVETKFHNLTPMEVAVRWIAHHSALREEDGIILGASNNEQICETVAMIKKGPLSKEVLKTVDNVWNAVERSRSDVI